MAKLQQLVQMTLQQCPIAIATLCRRLDSKQDSVNYTIRKGKKVYFNSKCRDTQSKILWKEARNLNLIKSKKQLPEHLSNPEDINNFFVNSLPDLQSDYELKAFYNSNVKSSVNSFLTFEPVDESTVFRIIREIKSSAVDIDEINIHTIHLCMPFILPSVTHTVNFCINNWVFS